MAAPYGVGMVNLYFATGSACNLRCKYCYLPEHKKDGDKKSDDLALASAREFVKKCRSEGIEIGTVTLHGAEPGLLSPEVAAAIANTFAEHSDYRHPVAIQSNGTFFSAEYFRRFESVADERLRFAVGVSIDGPREITERVRGKGVYRRSSAGLDAANASGYKTQVLCVVSSVTFEHLDKFGEWMSKLVQTKQDIRFKPAHGTYRIKTADQIAFADWLHRTEFARFYQEIDNSICSNRGNSCLWLEVDIEGNCYSCNKPYGGQNSFANWREETLQQIVEKRKRLYAGVPTNPACASCEIVEACNSGCPLERDETGLATDCRLKLALLSVASRETGHPWRHIVDVVSQFQLAGRHSRLIPISKIRQNRSGCVCTLATNHVLPVR